jgi:predicted Rossmann fold flavoprotein
VVVVGAGAAGIFASLRAAEVGARVLLIEKTPRIGTKILISGGGKCNIAHEGPIEEVLKAFRPNEARFLRPSVYRMPNRDIIQFFTDRGLEVYTRPDGRVFPVHQTAKEVVGILRDLLREAKVRLCLETPVAELLHEDGRMTGVRTGASLAKLKAAPAAAPGYGAKALLREVLAEIEDEGASMASQVIECPRVVLAVGGSSYPNSGTTGDGYPWVRALGHGMVRVRAALAPIYLELDSDGPERAGVALRGVLLKAKAGGKEAARWRNDLLFTHQGVSGPSVLGISRIVAEKMEESPVELLVDLLPEVPHEELQEVLQASGRSHPRRVLGSWMDEILPSSLVQAFLHQAGIDPSLPFGQLGKKDRNRLIDHIKAWPIGQVRTVSLEKGECVAGGVSLDEVDPHTMKSSKKEGLYLCGEILDIAGPVGGYNLQAAFATGHVAGESAAQGL